VTNTLGTLIRHLQPTGPVLHSFREVCELNNSTMHNIYIYAYSAYAVRTANNESSEFFDIIKPCRRVKLKGYRQ